jgi:hypothetical protein
VAVLTHDFWVSHFGSDATIVGKTFRLNDSPVRVIGVLPPKFALVDANAELWQPYEPPLNDEELNNHMLLAVGRLREGVSLSRAEQELAPILRGVAAVDPKHITHGAHLVAPVAQATAKIRELIKAGGAAIEGPWDGEEAITMYPDLEAGATGCMSGGGYPDGLRPIFDDFQAGRRDAAFAGYQRWLPLINYENRQCGLLAAKALMKEGRIIASETPRHPLPPLHPVTRASLIETARRLDPLVLRWGK